MPEYTYLLDTRLTPAQSSALRHVRDAVREAGMTVFLAGGAVRDLTTGSSVRDLDFSVQGNALELQGALEARGAVLWGRHEPSRTLHFWFPGSVRVEVTSTRSETFPKPGQPVYTPSSIVDDLRRRDFTANAMALSLNEGSYGLLLDPLNGVADIEARQLRLASNYGFLEDPIRMVRAIRLRQRLGWQFEERTATRYENAKESADFGVLSAFARGYELEEIAAEEDALPVMEALEAEGWLQLLFAGWRPDSVDRAALADLHASRIELLMQGIAPDLTAAHLELLTAKMPGADRERFKAAMARPDLRAHWEGLEAAAKEFAKQLTGKEAAQPSAAWKLFHTAPAEPILWLAHGRKTPAGDGKFKNLFTVWPEVAKQVPTALMLELRITPELPNYSELLHELFLKQIDGELATDEAMRAFLEPYSPPAPPPPVTVRRARGKKGDSKGKRKGERDEDDDEDDDLDEDDRPARARRDDDDEDDGSEDEDEPDEIAAVSELGSSPKLNGKLNLDSIDLETVLGRIASDADADADAELDEGGSAAEPPSTEGDDEEAGGEEEAAPRKPAAVAAKAAPPAKKAAVAPTESKGKPAPGVEGGSAPAKLAAKPTPAKAASEAPAAKPAEPKGLLGKPVAVSVKAAAAAKQTPPAPAKALATPAKAPAAPAKAAPANKAEEPAAKAVLAKVIPAKAAPVKSAGKSPAPPATAPKVAKPAPKPTKPPASTPAKKDAPKATTPAKKR